MKKIILLISLLLLAAVAFFTYKFSFEETDTLNAVYLIPRNAVYFVQSDTPLKSWRKIRDSEMWQFLQTNAYFSQLTASANSLDTILRENKTLFDYIGEKKTIISAHPISSRNYDFLFIVDLDKKAQFLQFKSLLKKIFKSEYRITERKYKEREIWEFFDKKNRETLYMTLINNNLVASFTHTLVEASITQLNEPTIGRDLKFLEIDKKIRNDGLGQIYIQYHYLDEFAYILTHKKQPWLADLQDKLVFSGFDIDFVAGNKWVAKGYTNTNDHAASFIQNFENAGTAQPDIAKVAPQRTSIYNSLCFADFKEFYKDYTTLLSEKPELYKRWKKGSEDIEKLLDISIQKDFVDWIGSEIALLKLEPVQDVQKDNFALVIKAKNADLALRKLNFITHQIKAKTPVHFKEINYKSYPIKYMAVKGFFNFFLGGYFKKLVTPYFTVIGDKVVFSNHPNTLKYMISQYKENNTLAQSTHYKAFAENFDTESNIFVYLNVPMLFPSIKSLLDPKTARQFEAAKKYVTAFSQIGFQLRPEDDVFKSKLVIQYQDEETRKFSDEFTVPEATENTSSPDEKPLVIVKERDPFDVMEIDLEDLNAKEFIATYPNGQIKVKVPIKNGMKNGIYRAYYKNGKLYFKGRFKNDKRTGKWKKYNPEGKKILQVQYD